MRHGGVHKEDAARRATVANVTTEINQGQLRTDSGEVMRRVEGGETFVVTRNGVPLAELRPLSGDRAQFTRREDALASGAHLLPVDLTPFRRDLDELVDPAPPLA